MTSIGDIFDLPEPSGSTKRDALPEGAKQYVEEEKEPIEKPKKERKKVEMSDEKKAAMLERLRAGREKRAENLKQKKEPKEEVKKEEVKKEKKQVEVKTNKSEGYEDERLSFIKMMAGKEKTGEKYERPKKKVISTPKEEPKKETKKTEDYDRKPEVSEPIISSGLVAPIAVVKEPVIIRTFKKPIWG